MPTHRNMRAPDRLTPVDRTAIVLTALCSGAVLSQVDLARMTGLRPASVYRFMARLSLRAPIYCERGCWRWCDGTETNE